MLPTLALSIGDVTVHRSDTSAMVADFQVTLAPAAVEAPVTVQYATQDGSATAAAGDYIPQSNTLTIPLGATTATIEITIPPKIEPTGTSNFFVNLSNPGGGGGEPIFIVKSQGVGTIVDDNPTHSLAINNTLVVRPDTGFAVATFNVSLTPAEASTPLAVNYATADGTATSAAGDYVPQHGTITFAPGQATRTINVLVPAKTAFTGNLTFFVDIALAGPDSGLVIITQGRASATILDPHAPGVLQFSSPSYTVDATAGAAVVTVTRLGGTASDVGISFATVGGTAIPGVDFLPTSGMLKFGFGQATATFTVPILVDPLALEDRSFSVVLGGPTGGATLGAPAVATVTIREVNPLIVTNTNDSGIGSLRQAILTANSLPFPPTISFNIPGAGVHVIAPPSALPAITRPTVVDAATQPGYAGMPLIDLVGTALPASTFVSGLVVTAGGTFIRGFAIGLFPGSGLLLSGGGGDVVLNTRIGTDPTGTVAAGNAMDGIDVANSSGNIIGGPGAGDVISGNGSAGIRIVGTSSGNVVQATWIGTDVTGRAAIPNADTGIVLDGVTRNVIGVPGAGDLISGNGSIGVLMLNGASANVVQSSLIGTDITGSAALPNVDNGVFLVNAPGNVIGGPSPVQGNIISGNGSVGVQIFGAAGGGNILLNDRIGTNAAGTAALANVDVGVYVNDAPGNVIGQAGAGNLISGNGSVGVEIQGASAFGNVVQGDSIGTDLSGRFALPNKADGVFILSASNNIVGGPGAGQGNLISGNGSVGVQILGPGASGNVILGNRIGTDASGTALLGNSAVGVYINNASGNVVGQVGAGNLISGNGSVGLLISGALASGNVAQANKIGTDLSGLFALANKNDGIFIDASPANVLGGSGSGQGNLVSGNGVVGLQILGAVASGTVVLGNLIGLDALGRPILGNDYGLFLNGFVVDAGQSAITTRNLILGNRVANVFQQPA